MTAQIRFTHCLDCLERLSLVDRVRGSWSCAKCDLKAKAPANGSKCVGAVPAPATQTDRLGTTREESDKTPS
jgi:ribosomal protein L37AE/L43A